MTSPASTKRNALGVWAVVCGLMPIATLVAAKMGFPGRFDWIFLLIWPVECIAATVLGVMSFRAASRGEATNPGLAILGLILAMPAVILLLISIVGILSLFI